MHVYDPTLKQEETITKEDEFILNAIEFLSFKHA